LDRGGGVAQPLVEELVGEQEWEKVVAVTRHRIISAESLSRPESLGLVKVMFSLRDLYLEKDVTEAVSALQDLARRILRQLGAPGQTWSRISLGEAAVLRSVVSEVDGIPPFVARLLETLLSEQGETRMVVREAGTQTVRKSLDHGGKTADCGRCQTGSRVG